MAAKKKKNLMTYVLLAKPVEWYEQMLWSEIQTGRAFLPLTSGEKRSEVPANLMRAAGSASRTGGVMRGAGAAPGNGGVVPGR